MLVGSVKLAPNGNELKMCTLSGSWDILLMNRHMHTDTDADKNIIASLVAAGSNKNPG